MLLGHPLDVVLWLAAQPGVTLRDGDLVSLGSLSPLTPAKAGTSLEAGYDVGGGQMGVGAMLTD